MTSLLSEAQDILPGVVDLRRKIHANPELGNNLPATTQAVVDAIADLPLTLRFSEKTTSIIATLEGAKPGKRILLRGDMDALPMPEDNDLPFASKNKGKMHACGHDAHTAMLAGAARVLSSHQQELEGTVDFFFQTGEEGYFGAKVVMDEGMLEAPFTPDAVFAIHITPLLKAGVLTSRPGTLLAAADTFKLVLRGKGGHASMPHDCLDPIPVACEIVQSMQTWVTRRVPVFDPVILTTTKIEAGTTTNVIPEIATVEGTLRSTSEKSRYLAHDGLRQLATNIAEAYDMQAEFEFTLGYPVTVNDADFVSFAQASVVKHLGEPAYRESRTPMMGAEDFSYLLQQTPGAMFFLGVRPEDASLAAPCHSNRMILNEDAMAHGVAAHAGIALDFLNG